jgi:hypothetical protein
VDANKKWGILRKMQQKGREVEELLGWDPGK